MNGEVALIYLSAIGATACAGILLYPVVSSLAWKRIAGPLAQYHQEKVEQATRALDELFMEVKPRWLTTAYWASPLGLSLVAFLATRNVFAAIGGAVVGLLLPDAWVRQSHAYRNRKFESQLVDVLFILSSSLRAGLSLTQAFEQVETEMPAPASQEFGLMMKAHRLGRSLEDALQRLNERMTCDAMQLITTAVLVARETGGDVTRILDQLVMTIRERKKLQEKVMTLTLQGRLQAYIMSFLPVGFATLVRTFNPTYFDPLLQDPTGKTLIVTAAGLWICGMVLLMRLAKVDI